MVGTYVRVIVLAPYTVTNRHAARRLLAMSTAMDRKLIYDCPCETAQLTTHPPAGLVRHSAVFVVAHIPTCASGQFMGAIHRPAGSPRLTF